MRDHESVSAGIPVSLTASVHDWASERYRHMSRTLLAAILAAGSALAPAACTAPNPADAGTQKSQANTVFVNPSGGGGGGGGGGY
jgi:hypothetical protein